MHSKRREVTGDWRLYLAVNDANQELFKIGATNNVLNRSETLTTDRPYGRHELKVNYHVPHDYHRHDSGQLVTLTANDIVKNANPVRWGIVRSFSSPRSASRIWGQDSCTNVEKALHVAFEEKGLKVCNAASNQANPVRCVELFRFDKVKIIEALSWLQTEAKRLQLVGAPSSKIGKYSGYTISDLRFIERLTRRVERIIA